MYMLVLHKMAYVQPLKLGWLTLSQKNLNAPSIHSTCTITAKGELTRARQLYHEHMCPIPDIPNIMHVSIAYIAAVGQGNVVTKGMQRKASNTLPRMHNLVRRRHQTSRSSCNEWCCTSASTLTAGLLACSPL